LVTEQFGFREKLSTEMATFTLLNKILLPPDRKILLEDYSVICKKHLIALPTIYFWPKWSFTGFLA
jgi:hypothetical protein